MKGHPVAYSRSVITELMVPSYTNFGGKVHGGTLMSLMDKLAYVCASKHAGNYCVTVSVDNVQFLRPVEVGEVSLMGSINYVGKKSLVVGIRWSPRIYRRGPVSTPIPATSRWSQRMQTAPLLRCRL